jgi:hypothetical protein
MRQHEILKKFIDGLGKGYANSLICVSKAGYGKTETTITTLNEMGLKEDEHYKYIANYITPVELYNLLQEVNNLKEPKILVVDDIEETLKNPRAIGILKGALWGLNNKRKVCWVSGTYKIKEKEFYFNGRVIFLLNTLKKLNPLISALKDRGFYYELELTPKEMLELIKLRAEIPYQNIPKDKRYQIAEYIRQIANNSPNLTLRILPKAFSLYQISPNHWQELCKELL